MPREKMQIMVCGGTSCTGNQGEAIIDNLRLELEANALENDIRVVRSGCFGLCAIGPVVKIMPGDTVYTKVTPDDAKDIVSEHIMKGRKVERLLFKDPASKKTLTTEKELASQKKQIRIVLRNCGVINPENIEDAIAHDGYEALAKVLMEWREPITVGRNFFLR